MAKVRLYLQIHNVVFTDQYAVDFRADSVTVSDALDARLAEERKFFPETDVLWRRLLRCQRDAGKFEKNVKHFR